MANAAAAATLNGRRGRNTQHTLDVDEEFMHFSGQHFAATRCSPDVREEFLHNIMGGPTGFTPLLYVLF